MKNKIALVTGATSGIGWACALTLAKLGYDLIATGRRSERLEELRLALPEGIRFLPLLFDVRDRAEVERLLTNLPSEWAAIDVLINNAGDAIGQTIRATILSSKSSPSGRIIFCNAVDKSGREIGYSFDDYHDEDA